MLPTHWVFIKVSFVIIVATVLILWYIWKIFTIKSCYYQLPTFNFSEGLYQKTCIFDQRITWQILP